MPTTYEPIAATTLGSTASSITFSSIPASYTDLRLVLAVASTSTGAAIRFYLNNDQPFNSTYSYTYLAANGTSTTSNNSTSDGKILLNSVSNTSASNPSLYTVDIFSYTGSTNKTVLGTTSQDYNGFGTVEQVVGLWRNTTAINRIDLSVNTGTFSINTTATLYGIKNA